MIDLFLAFISFIVTMICFMFIAGVVIIFLALVFAPLIVGDDNENS